MNNLVKRTVSLICAGTLAAGCFSAYADKASAGRGDVNGDGMITVTDISKIAAHVKSKKMLEGDSFDNADVNYDGKVNVTDISLIAAYVKGKKSLPADPKSSDEAFKGYDAFLMFADGSGNWGNWNGQGYYSAPSYGVDADITQDGIYKVSITCDSITAKDDIGVNPSLTYYEDEWSGERYLNSPEGCTILCVDITGLLDGTLAADGSELEGFLEDGNDANINKRVKGTFRGDEIEVRVTGIQLDGSDIDFDADKIRYGNLDEEDNCYRIEIANLLTGDAEDAAIDVDSFSFWDSLTVEFSITGISGDLIAPLPDDDF